MDVKVLGAAMTRFGRHADADLRSLAEQATAATLSDAGFTPESIQMVVFGNATAGLSYSLFSLP